MIAFGALFGLSVEAAPLTENTAASATEKIYYRRYGWSRAYGSRLYWRGYGWRGLSLGPSL